MCEVVNTQQAALLLRKATQLTIACHISPDGDTLGSALALAEALRYLGKTVAVYVDDDLPRNMSFLHGMDKVRRPEAGEQIAADLVVSIDASSIDRLGLVPSLVKAPLLNIDHHPSNTHYADYLLLDAEATATALVTCRLLEELAVPYTKEIATCLYTGLATDSGFFAYSNTTPEALRYAALLVEAGAEPVVISDSINTVTPEYLFLLSKVLPTLEFNAGGKISSIDLAWENYNPAISTESFVDVPRYIEGVDVGIFFKAVAPDITRVSMRSRTVDVAQVAVILGGGGHQRAAGCTVYAPLKEAKAQVLALLCQALSAAK